MRLRYANDVFPNILIWKLFNFKVHCRSVLSELVLVERRERSVVLIVTFASRVYLLLPLVLAGETIES
jgi:hypothetical protein